LGEVIDKFNSKLSRVVQESNEEDVEYARKAILEKINDTAIEIRGILGAATITMKELLSLQVGDVIKLDQSVDSQTLVTVNGKKWFYGQPGIKKNKIAVKINQKYS
jgi:flagellar motor switch protein FliM